MLNFDLVANFATICCIRILFYLICPFQRCNMGRRKEKFVEEKARINCEIRGKPAEIFNELKRRGLITSARDAVVQGLACLYEKVLERDLREAQLKASKRINTEL